MITKEITIAGKQVTLGYCFATEIGFKTLADKDLTQFIQEVAAGFTAEPKVEPDKETVIRAIIASAVAYYESRGEEPAITDRDLMYEATVMELSEALGYIIQMFAQFYNIAGLVEDTKTDKNKKPKRKPKNA